MTIALVGILFAQLDLRPSAAPADQAPVVRLTGLTAGERVVVEASQTDGSGRLWKSRVVFVAGLGGVIDSSAQRPVEGSYDEVSSSGLLWSMLPADGNRVNFVPSPDPVKVTIRAAWRDTEASAVFEQRWFPEGVQRIPIRERGIVGVLMVPAGKGPFPGLLMLGGSEGGMAERRAALLARHGFSVLALAYFGYEHLPTSLERIPIEYFETALEVLARRPEVQSAHLGVVGNSRGGELALQLGSMFQRIHAVVACVPSDVRVGGLPAAGVRKGTPAWTWRGNPLPFDTGEIEATRDAAAIEVERINGPVLLVSAQDDRVWPSDIRARRVLARLKEYFHPFSNTLLSYPHAGHMAPNLPSVPGVSYPVRNPRVNEVVEFGGTPRGNGVASTDYWPRVVSFLQEALREYAKPELGTWVYNPKRSQDPDPYQFSQMVVEDAPGGVTVTTTRTTASGQKIARKNTYVFDGIPRLVEGMSGVDHVAMRKLSDFHTLITPKLCTPLS